MENDQMTLKGKLILAGVAAATVGLAAAGAMAQRGHWDGPTGGRHMGGGFGGGGLMSLGFGGPYGRVCRGDTAEFADHILVRIEHRVDPTDAQKSAFEEFKTATRTAAQKLREGCPKKPEAADKDQASNRTPIDRLAQTQAGLEASLAALKEFRPAAEKFYASLSDDQKAKLEPRRGKGWGNWGKWRRDRGGDDRPDAAPDNDQDKPTPDDKG
jgi:hypothetical protein